MEYDCDSKDAPISEKFPPVDRRKCERLLLRLFCNDFSTDFQQPASPSETRRYKELIKTPMDLSIVKRKLESKSKDSESYVSPESFVEDVRLIFFNCAKYYKPTSEVGSAGLYLEDYFEEQLKLIYPDRVFPGGREEQMIPPLEDEIDEEEEMMEDGAAAVKDKPQSPAGKGIPPVEEDTAPLEDRTTPAAKEKSEAETSEKKTGKAVAATEGGAPPADEVKQENVAAVKRAENSPATPSDTKDGVASSSTKEVKPRITTDTTTEPPEAPQKTASVDTAKEKR